VEVALVKTVLILAFVVIMGFIIVNRERVYVRDPLATVYRNEVEQSGVQVFQNYSNDVLVEKDGGDNPYRILVQDWNEIPATPVNLICIHWMACVASADRAPTLPLEWKGKGKYDAKATMTNKEVSFVDVDGSRVRVQLR
jgi:hypothetical protein